MTTVFYESIELKDNLFCKYILHENSSKCVMPHFHSCYEFTCPLVGMTATEINGETEVIGPGEMSFINSDDIHHAYNVDGVFRGITVQIPKEILSAYYKKAKLPRFKVLYRSAAYEHILKDIMNIYSITQTKRETNVLQINSLVLDILFVLISECQNVDGEESESNKNKGNKYCEYVRENYKKDVTLESVAQHFGFSRTYFSSLFHEETGISFYSFLMSLRYGHAVYLLFTTKDSISYIAEESGFKNERSFSDLFKKQYKITPGQYRMQQQEEEK